MEELNFKVSKYEKQGFKGIDANLDISLNEYRLIWKKYERANQKKGIQKNEYVFVFINDYNEIDHSFVLVKGDKKEWFKSNYSFVEWNQIFSFVGQNETEFFQNSTPVIISDLVNYYGSQNIFGE